MILFRNDTMTVFQSQLFKTTSTVIRTNDCIIVVDPTWLPQEVEDIRLYVNKIKDDRPVYLLFTHSDWDHIIGYGAFPEAKVIASEGFVMCERKPAILDQIHEFDGDYYLDRNYPIIFPKVDIVIKEDGEVLQIGKTTLTFYIANGHTNDGLFTVVEPLGVWLAGDYLSDIEFPFIYTSSTFYEETMEKAETILSNHTIRFLVPGHGQVAENKEEILLRKENSLNYITELRRHIQENVDSMPMIKGVAYPRGMRGFHEDNIKLITKELSL